MWLFDVNLFFIFLLSFCSFLSRVGKFSVTVTFSWRELELLSVEAAIGMNMAVPGLHTSLPRSAGSVPFFYDNVALYSSFLHPNKPVKLWEAHSIKNYILSFHIIQGSKFGYNKIHLHLLWSMFFCYSITQDLIADTDEMMIDDNGLKNI